MSHNPGMRNFRRGSMVRIRDASFLDPVRNGSLQSVDSRGPESGETVWANRRLLKRADLQRIGPACVCTASRWARPELHRLLDQLRKGDVLVVWKLDRLSRSLRDLVTIKERLGEAKAGFRSLTEAIDTTTPAGRMMMQMVGAFAEFERAMLEERTKAGLDAARQEGRIGGRRPKLSVQQQAEIQKMVARGDKTGADAARLFTRLRSRGSWAGLRRQHPGGEPPAPNSMQSSTPNKMQSDRAATPSAFA
jgi:hypothetical protein